MSVPVQTLMADDTPNLETFTNIRLAVLHKAEDKGWCGHTRNERRNTIENNSQYACLVHLSHHLLAVHEHVCRLRRYRPRRLHRLEGTQPRHGIRSAPCGDRRTPNPPSEKCGM